MLAGNTRLGGIMTKIIAAVNNKGGVGKTYTTEVLGEYLSIYLKKRVLGIDFDSQGNYSATYLKMEDDPAAPGGFMPPIHPDYDPNDPYFKDAEGRSSIADIFYEEGRHGVLPYPTYIENLDILPAYASKLLGAEQVRRNEVVEKVHKQLGLFLADPAVREAYDVILIDTAPSKGPLTVSVVKAATHIFIPTLMEDKAVRGIYGMLQLWKQEFFRRGPENPLELLGILPNMFEKINVHRNLLASFRQNEALSKYVMPVELGKRTIVKEAGMEGSTHRSIFDLPDSNIAKQEALNFCQYVAERVFKNE
jgi:chromosome partitioning protein